ncbi:hypothetical protein [Amycolatopsis kentuckyensis]|uniref:hypothetical protein n=1 Tax=Amycolatopsis kentuckyensis TaxID=218823 RepID=UPI000A36D782|nr:hypothetical protein [Amycolatopsis kentuckyensis]
MLHAHAESVAALGRDYADLAERHRAAADAGTGPFGEWISRTAELAVAAERLLAREVALAREAGVTWVAIAGALGVSRQAAWKRWAGVRPGA